MQLHARRIHLLVHSCYAIHTTLLRSNISSVLVQLVIAAHALASVDIAPSKKKKKTQGLPEEDPYVTQHDSHVHSNLNHPYSFSF